LRLGLNPGDRVASLLPNRGALIVHYLACIRAGLVATPLNYRYQAPEIDHALEVSGAAVIVAHTERDDDLAKSKLAGGLALGRISFGAADGRQPSLEGGWPPSRRSSICPRRRWGRPCSSISRPAARGSPRA
jgi:long-chain acyl-CoA synthetase